jgi:hypothetical protein
MKALSSANFANPAHVSVIDSFSLSNLLRILRFRNFLYF